MRPFRPIPAYSLAAVGAPEAPTSDTTYQFLAVLSDGTANNRADLVREVNSGDALCDVVLEGANVFSDAGAAWSQSTAGKLGVAAAAATQNCAFNAAVEAGGSAAAIPATLSRLDLGELAGSFDFFNGSIARATLWNGTPISAAALKQVTH